VGELAAAVDVNESTVVRFATGLGLDGYPGLTRLCRERLREQAQLLRRFSDLERLDQSGDVHDLVARAAAFDQANIARTLARVDPGTWSAAVTALAEAPRVHVLGLRSCYTGAFVLGHLLQVVRDDIATLHPGVGTLVDGLRRVGSHDCFVGIAIHPYSRDTVRGFRWARKGGATTIALTDNPSSPLAREADHSFYVDTTGVAVLRSVTAFVSLAQALANAVAAERGARARSTLTLEEELLEEFQVYE
jgi:DNA-binding MurR/RpiR family transcriptional regulator